MKFMIYKTSGAGRGFNQNDDGGFPDIVSPDPTAYLEEYVVALEAPANDVEGDERLKRHWFKGGFNHRQEGDLYKQDIRRRAYFIDFATLEELMAWADTLDYPIILDGADIEIYDDYRE